MNELNIPNLEQVSKLLRDVVIAILSYQDTNKRSPFRLSVTIREGVIGQYGEDVMNVSLSNPKSLEHRDYTVSYIWGHSNEEYVEEMRTKGDSYDISAAQELGTPDVAKIAQVLKYQTPSPTYIVWNKDTWRRLPQARKGYKELERLLRTI